MIRRVNIEQPSTDLASSTIEARVGGTFIDIVFTVRTSEPSNAHTREGCNSILEKDDGCGTDIKVVYYIYT